jgi:hypothetical protein
MTFWGTAGFVRELRPENLVRVLVGWDAALASSQSKPRVAAVSREYR